MSRRRRAKGRQRCGQGVSQRQAQGGGGEKETRSRRAGVQSQTGGHVRGAHGICDMIGPERGMRRGRLKLSEGLVRTTLPASWTRLRLPSQMQLIDSGFLESGLECQQTALLWARSMLAGMMSLCRHLIHPRSPMQAKSMIIEEPRTQVTTVALRHLDML